MVCSNSMPYAMKSPHLVRGDLISSVIINFLLNRPFEWPIIRGRNSIRVATLTVVTFQKSISIPRIVEIVPAAIAPKRMRNLNLVFNADHSCTRLLALFDGLLPQDQNVNRIPPLVNTHFATQGS